ncbi:hypothetical protein HD600_000595 [Microbacterium ginsengiterrae]|uniref:Uncharacterized protein n=1 Tax=Microbacterium ginsengiterrae TaxID=546115 RepID=A0A7W9CAU1_9MICO|nr:hypothetical protein [Microbacterium ginsengiterrae]
MSLLTYPSPTPPKRDVGLLIQRNLIQPKLNRGYLAFDKCTLLSSQGSDAPTTQSHNQARRATSLSYPPRSACQIDALTGSEIRCAVEMNRRRGGPPILDAGVQVSQVKEVGGGSPLEGGEALGLSASLWGEQVITYAGSRHRANPARFPGVSRSFPACSRENGTGRPWGPYRAGWVRLSRSRPRIPRGDASAAAGHAEGPPPDRQGPFTRHTQMALTSSGMPGPNVVDTAPFWM